jgi:UDP-2,3-diacylglucosamine pyrophosphatase LpxH
MKAKGPILCLPDTHLPWINKSAVSKLIELIPKIKPKTIIQLGDLYDLYSMSRFPRSQNIITPADEILEARMGAEELWRILRKKAPRAQCYQIVGNHDALRIQKKVYEKAPELEAFLNYKHLWEFKGVETYHDFREPLVLEHEVWGPIYFQHGFLSRPGQHAKHFMGHTVHGHIHKSWLHWVGVHNQSFFELNCGYLADPHSKVLNYTKTKFTEWTAGVGVIDDLGPRFINLENKTK